MTDNAAAKIAILEIANRYGLLVMVIHDRNPDLGITFHHPYKDQMSLEGHIVGERLDDSEQLYNRELNIYVNFNDEPPPPARRFKKKMMN